MKQCKQFPSYLITRRGKVYSKLSKKWLKPGLDKNGYHLLSLMRDKKKTMVKVHRLTYEAYKGKIPRGYVINHLDLTKDNNHIDNLEACTIKHNVQHYWENIA